MTSAKQRLGISGFFGGALYAGEVVHVRRVPKFHRLKYSVFTLALEVDRIPETCARVRGLSYNRFNIVSVNDADHGAGSEPIADHAYRLLHDAGLSEAVDRIILVCYPRILGYVFNPISTYYGLAADGRLRALIYEVNNTFGERTSYVLAAGDPDPFGAYHQACAKEMSVSPFTDLKGGYRFAVTPPAECLTLGIVHHDGGDPVLRTHYRARKHALTSTSLVWHVLRRPFLTLKVIAAIHFEALRLFLKGVPLIRRRKGPAFKVATEASTAPPN